MKCILCGTENSKNEEVCSKCGNKLKNNPVADKLSWLKDDKKTEEIEQSTTDNKEQENEAIETKADDETVENHEENLDDNLERDLLENDNIEKIEIDEDGIIEVNQINETETTISQVTEKASVIEKISGKFEKLKEIGEKIFSTKNMVVALVGIVLLFFVALFIIDMFSEEEQRYSVAYESVGTLNIHDSNSNDKIETVAVDDDFDYELVKTSNSSYFYPNNISVENGVIKFDVVQNNGKVEERKVTNAYEDYLVSLDGRYIVYFTNIKNLYGENVGDMYYIDTKKNSSESLISSNVIISSVKISDESDEIIYINSDEYELCRYTFGKSKPKKLDDNIDEIIYVSDDLSEILYVRPQKKIGDMYLYTLNSIFGNSNNKITSNVVKDSIHYSDNGVIYLKAPKSYPSFSLLNDVTSNLTKSEIKELKSNFDAYCNENFFMLCESDFKGKDEKVISENVYNLNFVSEDGSEMIISRFKDVSKVDKNDIKKVSDLVNPKNIESYVVDAERNMYQVERVSSNKLLSIDENYGYNEDLREIYYLDGNSLVKFSFSSGFTSSIIVDDVKKLWYVDNNLIYLTYEGELYQIYNDGDPKKIDNSIIEESISFVGESLYYEKKGKNDAISLYVKTENSKSKKLSDDLENKEFTAFDNYIYFVDKKDGLSYYNGKKTREIDKNAKEVHLLTNGLQGE